MFTARVAFVQPVYADYRLAFYTRLTEELTARHVGLDLYSGRETRARLARGDELHGLDVHYVSTFRVGFGSFALSFKWLPRLDLYDLVVVEHGSTILENYLLLARKKPRVALWGHGGGFVSGGATADLALERWQIRRSCHYFAYTEDGASRVVATGMPSELVTVVNNSTDVRSSAIAVEEARRLGGDGRASRTVLVIGSLDSSKRVDLIVETGRLLSSAYPDFRLLIVGDGVQRDLVYRAAEASGSIEFFGRRNGAELASIAARASLILNPGRVGLVAVDSIAFGLPIVTCENSRHAPEYSYLSPGVDAVVAKPDAGALSRAIGSLFDSRERLLAMQEAISSKRRDLGVENMASRFAMGIMQSLSARDS